MTSITDQFLNLTTQPRRNGALTVMGFLAASKQDFYQDIQKHKSFTSHLYAARHENVAIIRNYKERSRSSLISVELFDFDLDLKAAYVIDYKEHKHRLIAGYFDKNIPGMLNAPSDVMRRCCEQKQLQDFSLPIIPVTPMFP